MHLPRLNQLSKTTQISLTAVIVLLVGAFIAVNGALQSQQSNTHANSAASIVHINLVNASTNTKIFSLQDGMSIAYASLPSSCLTLRVVTNPSPVGSVKFGYDGNANYRIDPNVPYDIGGDQGGLPKCWTLTVGNHTVIATAYTGTNADGNAGTPVAIHFRVTNALPTDTPVPTHKMTMTPTPQPRVSPTPTTKPTYTPTPPSTGKSTPTPIVSAAPTMTTAPTPTAVPGTTLLAMNVFLHGIGNGGDSSNPNSQGTFNPLHPTRTATVQLFDSQNNPLSPVQGQIIFNQTSGGFTGTIDLGGDVQTGSYTIKVTVPQYLTALVPGIQTITAGQTNPIAPVYLIAGNLNGDNQINILDYNILMGCYSDLLPPANCPGNNAVMADLTDDGAVNAFDYNLFIRELSNHLGQ